MKRRFKVALASLGLLGAGAGVFAGTWPYWLESYAEDKMMAVLSSKFEDVEHGEFELTKSQVIVKDLVLSNPDAHVSITSLTVDFTPMWWDKKVTINQVELEGGNSKGTLEAFKELKSSDDSKKKRSGRVDLSSTTINVKDFGIDLEARGYRTRGTIMATSTNSLAGPFDVTITDGLLGQQEDVLVSASSITTSVKPKELFPFEVQVDGLSAELKDVAIKDVEGTVGVKDSDINELNFDLRGKTKSGQTWSFNGDVDREKDLAQGHLVANDIVPGQLPISDLPIDPEHGLLSVEFEVTKEKDLVTAQGKASVQELRVKHHRLSKHTVVLGADLELKAKADLGTRELELESLIIQPRVGDHLSSVKVQANGRVLYLDDPSAREYEFEMHMDANPCQEVLDVMPPGLLPGLSEFELGGETSLDLKVVVHMAAPDETVLEGGLETKKCKIKEAPKELDMLAGPFMHLVKMKNGQVAQRPLMPGHAFYARFDDIPPSVPGAVLSTEDGGFWKHKGWRASAFHESLVRNVELGTFRRGASTLTMQMVKNTLLTHEKTVSRKLQEIFLTWAVEQVLSKKRILEIYLNVVEFGPGIYGVAHAADHYYGKDISQINSLEAAFLATLLPRPISRHEMWCRGKLTPKHDKYVRKVHARMLRRERITQEDYDEGELEGIVFSRIGFTNEKSCIAEGKRMSAGKHVQGALSGLLGEHQ